MTVPWLNHVYVLSVAGIALFGLLGSITLFYYHRHRHRKYACPIVDPQDLPPVTVQLPIYNERYVVRRLIESAVKLDYPRDRLQIQVIDDSTDDTTARATKLVDGFSQEGVNIELHHRQHREGYKAGALRDATSYATGEYIAVFDADFVPEPDFLLKTVPHFLNEQRLGMVQARWGHLNPNDSHLTAAQSIALDKHFAMELTVRHRANMYPKFNGSGGVWRRKTLEDSGGWLSDTVCEDLCLSTRAILRGWKFRFLNEVVAPAELPTTLSAYKNQQARWAKGSTQCLVKYGPSILRDRDHSLLARSYALLSMAGYTTHLLLIVLLLVQVPLVVLGFHPPTYLLVFGIIGLSQPILFVLGQKVSYPGWWRRLRYFPAMLIIAIGLAPANSRAILQTFLGKNHVFIRTPKGRSSFSESDGREPGSERSYALPVDWIVIVEFLLALYAAFGLAFSLKSGNYGPVFFLMSCMVGLGYVAFKGVHEAVFHSRFAP